MYRILLVLILLLGAQSGMGQIQQPTSDSLFLGIDPHRNLEQYGHDPASLHSDLNPFPLAAFNQGSHQLSDLDFDSEIILFNKQGALDGIVLSKLFSKEVYGQNNKQEAAALFSTLEQRLEAKMGPATSKKAGLSQWNTAEFNLRLVINRETSVQVFYEKTATHRAHANFIEEPFDIEINEKTFTIRKVEDLDAAVVELFNGYLEALNQELVRSFARKNGNQLDIFFEREVDLRPEEKQGEIKKAARVLEETLINSYAEQVLMNVFDQQNDLDLLRTIQVNGLNFVLDMFYGDGSETRLTKQISVGDLETLQFPINRRNARELLRGAAPRND